MDSRAGFLGARRRGAVRTAGLLAVLVPGALLAGALGSQYLGGLAPCEMCYWQRYPHWAALALGILSFVIRPQARPLIVLAALAIAVSGGIGLFHAGVEQGWWEGLTSCATFASGGSPDELLKSILATPLVRCDQVQWTFLGLSLAAWNTLISLTAAGAILWLSRKR